MSIQENTSELEAILEQVNNLPNANVEHNHDDLYYTKTESDTLLNAKSDSDHTHSEYRIKTYSSFTQINLTNGSETIDSIATNMSNHSMMITTIGASNAAIYPNQYGTLEVIKAGDNTRVVFRFYQKTSGKTWYGSYDSTASTKWTGWAEIGSAEDYLPLDGSVDMTGNLRINKSSYPSLALYNGDATNRILLQRDGTSCTLANQTSDGSSAIVIYPNSKALASRIQLVVDNSSWYDLFGEHNIDLLSSSLITTGAELTSGVSSLGKGKIHLVFEE